MKRTLIFALASAVIILAIALVMGLFFPHAAEQRAIRVSALVAWGVQLFGFLIVKVVRGGATIMAAWGLGVLLRFVVLALYAFVVVKALALPPEAALLSLVAFFFLTTLVEPMLLKS
ncbi:MAG TPA: hypothetical protein VFW89_00180 [Gemmatimonadaceae bacterium]|nr:hypothetical protein [Gemmatimonadaceae bacterium]